MVRVTRSGPMLGLLPVQARSPLGAVGYQVWKHAFPLQRPRGAHGVYWYWGGSPPQYWVLGGSPPIRPQYWGHTNIGTNIGVWILPKGNSLAKMIFGRRGAPPPKIAKISSELSKQRKHCVWGGPPPNIGYWGGPPPILGYPQYHIGGTPNLIYTMFPMLGNQRGWI